MDNSVQLFDISSPFTVECVKRIEAARAIPTSKIIALDADSQVALIQGSDEVPYHVTLCGCSCVDYQRRREPCKHMYRLAMELGDCPDLPIFDPYKASEYDISEDVERLTNRWSAGQLTTDAYIKCVEALQKSSSKAKRKPGRPKKQSEFE